MFGLPLNYWVAIAIGVAGLVYTFWDYIPGLWSGAASWVGRKPAKTKAKPDRKAALLSFDDLMAFLEAEKCTEGVDYFKAGLPHLYHKHAE